MPAVLTGNTTHECCIVPVEKMEKIVEVTVVDSDIVVLYFPEVLFSELGLVGFLRRLQYCTRQGY